MEPEVNPMKMDMECRVILQNLSILPPLQLYWGNHILCEVDRGMNTKGIQRILLGPLHMKVLTE